MPQYDQNLPIYHQVMEMIGRRIVTGEWPPGSRIPSVRDLAVEFSVNPGTMQRALSELERDGLLESERTAGRFVTENTERIKEMRTELTEQAVKAFLQQMAELGLQKQEIIQYVIQEVEKQ